MITFSWQLSVSGTPSGSSDARDLALDPVTEDLLVVDGDLVIDTGAEAYVSDLKSRLQTFAREYFLDTSIGVPWLEPSEQYPAILGSKPNLPRHTEIFRAQISDTPGTVEILQLAVVVAGRELRVSFRVSIDTEQIITGALTLAAGG